MIGRVQMKLRYAMICIECDEIFEPEASANGVVMRLSKWIDTMASYAEVTG